MFSDRPAFTWFVMPISIITFGIAGVAWGASMWSNFEGKYLESRKRTEIEDRVQQLEKEINQLRNRMPPSNDTNITELPD